MCRLSVALNANTVKDVEYGRNTGLPSMEAKIPANGGRQPIGAGRNGPEKRAGKADIRRFSRATEWCCVA